MSALAADIAFDFTFPATSIEEPSTPPTSYHDMSSFSFDPSLLELPFNPGHARSSSKGSVYSVASGFSGFSAISNVESTPDTVCTRLSTPPRASPPVHHHGPLLLPKIRSQDQNVDMSAPSAVRHRVSKMMTPPSRTRPSKPQRASTAPVAAAYAQHTRSYTNPEALNSMAFAHMSFTAGAPTQLLPQQQSQSQPESQPDSQPNDSMSNLLLCSPVSFAQDNLPSRRASSCSVDAATLDKYGYPTYRQMPFVSRSSALAAACGTVSTTTDTVDYGYAPSIFVPRATSPLSLAGTPEPESTTTLVNYLTTPNPAASLVRNISFPMRDPHAKHFWWDIRNIGTWTSFNASTIFSLPGASALLTTPVPIPALAQPAFTSRHPETEAALHNIYAAYYLPKLNSALAMSSTRPMQFSSAPSRASRPGASSGNDLVFTANVSGESASAAAMFGGNPTARVVGIVRSFDRFNTGMRAEGNIKRVEYLRGLAAIHHAMREHGCRYGFILTEIELVLVRNGTESTPFFGDLEVTSVQLADASSDGDAASRSSSSNLTACLALWGICQLAADEPAPGNPHWRAEIGAPAEGTRRKAKARDSWIPQPQLAEKREAKRSRGWIWPEDAIGRKELGKRGVKYSGA